MRSGPVRIPAPGKTPMTVKSCKRPGPESVEGRAK